MSLTFACQSVRWSTILGLCIHLLVYSLFMYSDCWTQISHPPAIDIQCRWVKLLSRIFQLKIAWLQCTLPRLIRQSSYYTSPSAATLDEPLNSNPVFGLEFMTRHTKYSAAYRHSMFNSPTRLASTRSFVQHTHFVLFSNHHPTILPFRWTTTCRADFRIFSHRQHPRTELRRTRVCWCFFPSSASWATIIRSFVHLWTYFYVMPGLMLWVVVVDLGIYI